MSTKQRYRLRNPATGRETVLQAEPDEIYLDRDTGEPLEVVRQDAAAGAFQLAAAVGGGAPAFLPVVRPARAEGPQRLPHVRKAHGPAVSPRAALDARRRALLAALALRACGGSSVSDAVPKSTPVITPPTDTSAEAAAAQTTSTSTTATKTTTSTTGESYLQHGIVGKRKRRQRSRAERSRKRSGRLRRRPGGRKRKSGYARRSKESESRFG